MDIMSIALARSLSGGSGGSGVSSWNDLKDKPFGEVVEGERTLFHKETITGNINQSNVYNTTPLYSIKGKKVYVLLNDVEYESIVVQSGGTLRISFGDYEIIQPVTNEYASLSPTVEGETYDLYIEVAETTFTKLDPKYLPYEDGNEVAY